MAQHSASESSAAVQQPSIHADSRLTDEALSQSRNDTLSSERAPSLLATAPMLATTIVDASSLPTTAAPAVIVHSNVLYRPSGIISLPEGTPASETSVIGLLRPATFSEPRSSHSVAASGARSQSSRTSSIHDYSDDALDREVARRRRLRTAGAYTQSRSSAPPAYAYETNDTFQFPQLPTPRATSEQLPASVSPVTTSLVPTNSTKATSLEEAMPVVLSDLPEATPEDINRFIEERVRLAARRYEEGLVSISTQRQTVNGTVFHGIPRLAMNKFFAANLNASGQFNPIPTDVRPQLGDYHHSADEFSANINAAVDNLSLPQQLDETDSNYMRRCHAHAWLSTPLVKGESSPTVPTSQSSETQKTVDALNEARREVFNRGLLQQLHDEDMLLFGQTMIPDQGVQIDIYGDATHPDFPGIRIYLPHIRSEVYNPLRTQYPPPAEEQNKVLISKLKGQMLVFLVKNRGHGKGKRHHDPELV
ncbi:hypothetical protein IW261DRAFT_1420637 [Armillaria novae-zelandiae]|uniref:Uncharacterized protein n=1 Tax=Armillaria novae-zelandiae TaxID=153914 RepID=A0AA39P5Q2_9AGAR|nr:hypothetical protein IW261DRAFT_1420637 [Armillaria novae-zelandiae]